MSSHARTRSIYIYIHICTQADATRGARDALELDLKYPSCTDSSEESARAVEAVEASFRRAAAQLRRDCLIATSFRKHAFLH